MRFRMFQPRFADLVEADKKWQTVRAQPKRMPQPGELESWRKWAGKPYRSPHVVIKNVRLVRVQECVIDALTIYLDGIGMNPAQCDRFAQADGFRDFVQMQDWIVETHGELSRSKPFVGIVIFAEGVQG